MFFPGETISHGFVIPFSASDIHHVVISYKQHDQIVFEKTVTTFTSKGTGKASFSVKLTQSQGLLFADGEPFTVQCNVYTKGGSRHTSIPIKGSTGTQYLREVMTND